MHAQKNGWPPDSRAICQMALARAGGNPHPSVRHKVELVGHSAGSAVLCKGGWGWGVVAHRGDGVFKAFRLAAYSGAAGQTPLQCSWRARAPLCHKVADPCFSAVGEREGHNTTGDGHTDRLLCQSNT